MSDWTSTDLRPEKRLLLVIGGGTALLLVLLWFAVMAPLLKKHRAVDAAIEHLDRPLTKGLPFLVAIRRRERAQTIAGTLSYFR